MWVLTIDLVVTRDDEGMWHASICWCILFSGRLCIPECLLIFLQVEGRGKVAVRFIPFQEWIGLDRVCCLDMSRNVEDPGTILLVLIWSCWGLLIRDTSRRSWLSQSTRRHPFTLCFSAYYDDGCGITMLQIKVK